MSEKEKDFARDLQSCLVKLTRNSWENMQRLLALILFGFKSTFKVSGLSSTLCSVINDCI